jgi:hypothetical protein
MSGWIKIHRDLNKHWIWDNSDYLKWWLDILLEVNHTDSKVVIKNKIYECKRGEKLYSLDTWATRWKTNKSKVRRFLDLLQKDSMIVLKSETQTTRLIVCKYEDYQELRHADETHLTRKRHANDTHLTPIQEYKEYKEGKEEDILNKSLLSEIKISDDKKSFLVKEKIFSTTPDYIKYFEIASSFQKLFIKNLKEKKSTTSTQEKATFKSYVDPIRLIIEKEEATREQLIEAYKFLDSTDGEFWKTNILSTQKLREKLSIILAKKNSNKAVLNKFSQQTTNHTKRKRFY